MYSTFTLYTIDFVMHTISICIDGQMHCANQKR